MRFSVQGAGRRADKSRHGDAERGRSDMRFLLGYWILDFGFNTRNLKRGT